MFRLTPFLRDIHNQTGSVSENSARKQVDALYRIISVLMQGIAIHGLQYDETAFHAFQDAVWKMRAGFEQAADEDGALLVAGAVIRLMEEHNERGQAHLLARRNEVSELLTVTLETLLEVTHANPQTKGHVRGIAQEISRASTPGAIEAVTPRLRLSLAEMRANAQLPVP